jgi:CRISPR-associated protein Cas6
VDGAGVSPVIDVQFPLCGRTLPRDHARALSHALRRAAPWLGGDGAAYGVRPVRLVAGTGAEALLSQRARLTLRVARAHGAALAALEGADLEVGGHAVRLGRPVVHELLAHSTLYAAFVVSEHADEALDALGVQGRCICGRAQRLQGDDGPLAGYSLMVDRLSTADSLTVQERGLGPHRAFGCGLFVPHRSAAALNALTA